MATGLTDVPDAKEAKVADAHPGAQVEEATREEQLQAAYRGRELEWRQTHREALQTFAGKWVVLEGEEIVAHGSDPVQVVAEARAKGIKVPYLFYVENLDKDVVRIGL